jgi:hypothetical protein
MGMLDSQHHTLGWSVCMWAYLLFRAVCIDHESVGQYSQFPTSSETDTLARQLRMDLRVEQREGAQAPAPKGGAFDEPTFLAALSARNGPRAVEGFKRLLLWKGWGTGKITPTFLARRRE